MTRVSLRLSFVALAVSTASASFAQSVARYAPVVRTTDITFSSIAATGNVFAGWRNGVDRDDNRSTATPIGFPFVYDGQEVTTFSVSTNGVLDFSGSSATGAGTGAYGFSNSTFSAPGGTLLALAPFYDDLAVPEDGLDAHLRYLVTGDPGSRILTVEWSGLEASDDESPDLSFQVKLHEAGGVIEFVYGTMVGGTAAYTYTCGINAAVMSSPPLASELLTQGIADSDVFAHVPSNALSTLPSSASALAFTPVESTPPAVPTDLVFTDLTQTSLTVGWTDASSSETYFAVLRSTDGVSYAPVGVVSSTTTGDTGGTYTLPQTGLAAGTTYHFRVSANNEASVPIGFLSGSQATNPAGTIASAATGNWSAPSTWVGGQVPGPTDAVTITSGHAVTIDTAASCLSLTVGTGLAATLRFEPATARTITVGQNVLINAGSSFVSPSSGSVTSHLLSLGGNLTNNGTLDFSTNANNAAAGIRFTGDGSATFGGSGATTDLRTLTVNKGTSRANVLELSPAHLTVQGSAADFAGYLTISNGTLRVSGTFTMANRTFATAAYTIGPSGGFWLSNPNYTVVGQNGSATLSGEFRISSGVFTVGSASGNSMALSGGASVLIEGGSVNVAGRWCVGATTNAITYTQTGGTLTVNTATGHSSTTLASFDLGTSAATSVVMSEGTIVLRNAGTAGSGPRDYRNLAGTQNLTGGSVQLGDASTVTAKTYRIQGWLPNLVVSNTPAGHTAMLAAQANVRLTTTIQAGASLVLNGMTLVAEGASLQNDGTLNGTTPGSRLVFAGLSGGQTYAGTGTVTAPLQDLTVQNPAGLTIDDASSMLSVTKVGLRTGVLTNSDRITLGTGGASGAITEIGFAGSTVPGGAFDVFPVLDVGTAGYEVRYSPESAPRTTGLEIPASRALAVLTVANPLGVTLTGGDVTVSNALALGAGLLETDAANLIVLAPAASAPDGSASSFVDGPLAIEVQTAAPATRRFAVGADGAFRPLAIENVDTGGVVHRLVAEVLDGAGGGVAAPPLEALDSARAWKLSPTSALNAGARVGLSFGADDAIPVLSAASVAQSASLDGSYLTRGGIATGSPFAGTVTSVDTLASGADFFTIGLASLPFTWDGGAGTTLWSDAANWNFDAVPDSGANVVLTTGEPATIAVDGSFTVGDVVVGANVTLDVASGSMLVVEGNADLVAGSVVLSGGTLEVGGATTISGCAVTASTGALLHAQGPFLLSGGSIDLGAGTLELEGSFARTGGTFTASSGTTLLSGVEPQAIGGGVTHHDLVLRNGTKLLSAGETFSAGGDLTVEASAEIGLGGTTHTTLSVAGNVALRALPGGAGLDSLTLRLTGTGKTLGGGSSFVRARAPGGPRPRVLEVDLRTDFTKETPATRLVDGKNVPVLEHTLARHRAEVDRLVATTDASAKLVVRLDDVVIVRNAAAIGTNPVTETGASERSGEMPIFEMPVTIASGASYALDGDVSIAPTGSFTVDGALDCGTFAIGGQGGLTVSSDLPPNGTLGIGASSGGVGASILTTGPVTYIDGCTIRYGAEGDQLIDTASHPATAMLYTAGSGTKSLDGDLTIAGNSGSPLSKGALAVGAGTTFADGGFTLSFTTSSFANVLVDGTYRSTGAGGISYEAATFLSNIRAADGTTFGDLTLNFQISTRTIDLNASGTSALSFRNIVFGGTHGAGVAGGTLRLNETGTTPVTVTGDVLLTPVSAAATGGGFGGTAATAGTIVVEGDLSSTSANPVQPIVNATGANTLVLRGPETQALTLAASAEMFQGATLRIDAPAGVLLGSEDPLVYSIAGVLELENGLVTTGGNTLAVTSSGTVARTNGHVVGTLRKHVSPGAPAPSFETGTAITYAPASVVFSGVTTPGDLSLTTVAGDAPNLETSGLHPASSVAFHTVVSNAGISFESADLLLTWDGSSLDAGADPLSFALGRYDGADWSFPVVTERTTTSISATDLDAFGAFQAANVGLSVAGVAVIEGNEGPVNASFAITLGAPSQLPVMVGVSTVDGTAVAANGDYTATTDTLTFAPLDSLTQVVSVPVHGDFVTEADETFFLDLLPPAGAALLVARGTGTILNDDDAPTLAIGDATVTEGDSGIVDAVFTVSLTNLSKEIVTVDVETVDGSALAGEDYEAIVPPETITFFPGGPLTQEVTVAVAADTLSESTETFTVVLSNATHALLGDASGLGTITDDDSPPVLAVDDVTLAEGDAGSSLATFTVSLARSPDDTVTVEITTADSTAIAATLDYVAIDTAEIVTFVPGGPLAQPVSVTILGDVLTEANETYLVLLANPAGATIGDGIGLGTITNDDAQPAVTIDDVSVAEGDTGTTAATFTVSLSRASAFEITMNVATADSTATVLDADFVPIDPPAPIAFPPGSPLTQEVVVLVNGDTDAENDEAFLVRLSDLVNATPEDVEGLGTILNDDGTVGVGVVPLVTSIGTARPNPFSTHVSIPVTLAEPGRVRVRVYDLAGRLVRTLADGVMPAGLHEISWDGETSRGGRLSSGVYLVRAEARDERSARLVRVVR